MLCVHAHMQEENKEKICQSLLVCDSLIKQKSFVDSLCEGLELFQINTLINSHTKLFEKKFAGAATQYERKRLKIWSGQPLHQDDTIQN